MDTAENVTQILQDLSAGDASAVERLMPFVYDELRRLAAVYFSRERRDHTLQPTALVHEAYLRLISQTNVEWQNRAHFFGVAAQMMRRILVDHARHHLSAKEGGSQTKVALDEAVSFPNKKDFDLVKLDEALESLAELDERKSRIVELKFFGGLSAEETALVLNISEKTVRRDWQTAKLWLYRELNEKG
ncbi:ECF-type sigma factor [soil metagenome]